MKTEVIRVQIRKGENLYFAESTDMASLKLANSEREKLIEEISAVIKYVYESNGRRVVVERTDSAEPDFETWIVSETLQKACG
jgi:hypothetical protein